ncbi:hypothetical protein PYCCODRAFT_1441150, partial [Trametes coccinea BRFM310]
MGTRRHRIYPTQPSRSLAFTCLWAVLAKHAAKRRSIRRLQRPLVGRPQRGVRTKSAKKRARRSSVFRTLQGAVRVDHDVNGALRIRLSLLPRVGRTSHLPAVFQYGGTNRVGKPEHG